MVLGRCAQKKSLKNRQHMSNFLYHFGRKALEVGRHFVCFVRSGIYLVNGCPFDSLDFPSYLRKRVGDVVG